MVLRLGAQAVVAVNLKSKRELMLRGADNRTLFMMAAEWRGTASMADAAQTGQVLIVQAPAPAAGWPWEPRR